MKYLIIISFFFFVQMEILGRNLVLNPSMEDFEECPTSNYPFDNSIEIASYWGSPTISSDYYSSCRDGGDFNQPRNRWGYQIPRTGNAYVGAAIWYGDFYDFINNLGGEYIEGSLSEPLEQDSLYIVEFYLNLANPDLAIGGISLLFTEEWADFYHPSPLWGISPMSSLTPDLTTEPGVYYTDTLNWQRVKWLYKARGGESFFTVGMFGDAESVDYLLLNEDIEDYIPIALYFFDDFRVEKIPCRQSWSILGRDTIICEEVFELELFSKEEGIRYLWNTGDTTQNIIADSPGIYSLACWLTDSCVVVDTILVEQLLVDSVDLGKDEIACVSSLPRTLSMREIPYAKYNWSTGDTLNEMEVTEEGIYWAEVTTPCGSFRDSIQLTVLPTPEWEVVAPEKMTARWEEEKTIPVTISGNIVDGQYEWFPADGLSCSDCLQPVLLPTKSQEYVLTVWDAYGCESEVRVNIEVVVPHRIYFPNAFSPNDDGINDIFTPLYGSEVLEVKQLLIFNRWGDSVFAGDENHFYWDGFRNGQQAAAGVYVFQAVVVFADGEEVTLSGDVLLLR